MAGQREEPKPIYTFIVSAFIPMYDGESDFLKWIVVYEGNSYIKALFYIVKNKFKGYEFIKVKWRANSKSIPSWNYKG